MLAEGQLVGFVSTRNLEVADRFYRGVLGLRRVESSEFALAYDVNGTHLRVTRVETLLTAPFTVLRWKVEYLSATVLELRSRGVVFERYEGLTQDVLDAYGARLLTCRLVRRPGRQPPVTPAGTGVSGAAPNQPLLAQKPVTLPAHDAGPPVVLVHGSVLGAARPGGARWAGRTLDAAAAEPPGLRRQPAARARRLRARGTAGRRAARRRRPPGRALLRRGHRDLRRGPAPRRRSAP